MLKSITHSEPGGTATPSCDAVTLASIHTKTWLQAAVTIETMSAGLITVQSRPPRLACALSFHGVAAAQHKQALI